MKLKLRMETIYEKKTQENIRDRICTKSFSISYFSYLKFSNIFESSEGHIYSMLLLVTLHNASFSTIIVMCHLISVCVSLICRLFNSIVI